MEKGLNIEALREKVFFLLLERHNHCLIKSFGYPEDMTYTLWLDNETLFIQAEQEIKVQFWGWLPCGGEYRDCTPFTNYRLVPTLSEEAVKLYESIITK